MIKKSTWLTLSVLGLTLFAVCAVQFYGPAGEAKATLEDQGSDASKKSPKTKPLPAVRVETVQSTSLSKTMNLTGSVKPTRTAQIASPGEGPVEPCANSDCMVREGDHVKKGQRLFKIGRNKTAEAQLIASKQALKEQELELQRVEQLVQGGAIPGFQLDAAQSKYENSRAQLARSMESIEDYSVTAPWSGIVSEVHVAEGDYVAPRTTLVEIFDPESLVIQFAVPEAQSTEVSNGMQVQVELDAHPGKTFQGKISRVYPQLDLRMHTRTVETTLTNKVDLLPGMFARIKVYLAQIPEALTVTSDAIIINAQGEQLAFVLQGKKVVQRKVTTGIEDAGRVQVIAGIDIGEQVIIAGNEKLKDGAKVQVHQGDKS